MVVSVGKRRRISPLCKGAVSWARTKARLALRPKVVKPSPDVQIEAIYRAALARIRWERTRDAA